MTFQISQRGKQYLNTVQTLLRAAQTMTDRAIAGQLKALAGDYERRAEKASLDDAAKALARSALALNTNGLHELMSSVAELCQLRKPWCTPRILWKKGLFRFHD
jgi:hypothetical protein